MTAQIKQNLVGALKSKTMWFSVMVAVLGALEANSQVIPVEYRGQALIVIAGVVAMLRILTTTSLDAK